MRVILTLKFRGEVSAIQPLIDLAFRHPVDVIEGLAIVDCLKQIGGRDGHIALRHLANHHPANAVSKAARNALF